MCLGGRYRSLGATFVKHISKRYFHMYAELNAIIFRLTIAIINHDYSLFLTDFQDFPNSFDIFLNFLGSFGMCLGGRYRSSGATFVKIILKICLV